MHKKYSDVRNCYDKIFNRICGLFQCQISVISSKIKKNCTPLEVQLMMTIFVILQWFPGDRGFMGSFAVAGYGFGGVIWNPLETAFVNPDNVEPEVPPEGGDDKCVERKFWAGNFIFVLPL